MFYFRIDRVRFLDNGGIKSVLGKRRSSAGRGYRQLHPTGALSAGRPGKSRRA